VNATKLPWLSKEWMQRGLNALKETVDPDPEIKRQMVEFLIEEEIWTDIEYEAALAKFNTNLNPNKVGHFKTSEIWQLMKRFDRHQFFLLMAEDLGYEVRRKPTEERRMELLERQVRAQEDFNRILEQCGGDLRRLGTEGVALRIHPAVASGIGAFALDEDAADLTRGF